MQSITNAQYEKIKDMRQKQIEAMASEGLDMKVVSGKKAEDQYWNQPVLEGGTDGEETQFNTIQYGVFLEGKSGYSMNGPDDWPMLMSKALGQGFSLESFCIRASLLVKKQNKQTGRWDGNFPLPDSGYLYLSFSDAKYQVTNPRYKHKNGSVEVLNAKISKVLGA